MSQCFVLNVNTCTPSWAKWAKQFLSGKGDRMTFSQTAARTPDADCWPFDGPGKMLRNAFCAVFLIIIIPKIFKLCVIFCNTYGSCFFFVCIFYSKLDLTVRLWMHCAENVPALLCVRLLARADLFQRSLLVLCLSCLPCFSLRIPCHVGCIRQCQVWG